MTIGAPIQAEAEAWVGTPFHWQGRLKGVGVDCKGLVAGVAAACARPEADSLEALCGDYGGVIDARRLQDGLARLLDRIFEPVAGCILLIRIDGKPQHLAIHAPRGASGGFRTIEAMERLGGVVAYRRTRAEIDSIWGWRDA